MKQNKLIGQSEFVKIRICRFGIGCYRSHFLVTWRQSDKNWVSLHSWLGLWGTLTLATCSIIEVTAQPRAKKADAMQTSDWKSSLFFDLIFSLHQKQITFASFHKLLQQELFKPPYNASNPLCSFQSSKMSEPALKSEDQNKWRRKLLAQRRLI